jgi:hypothetical protein
LNDTTAAKGVVLDVFDHCRSAPTPDECHDITSLLELTRTLAIARLRHAQGRAPRFVVSRLRDLKEVPDAISPRH